MGKKQKWGFWAPTYRIPPKFEMCVFFNDLNHCTKFQPCSCFPRRVESWNGQTDRRTDGQRIGFYRDTSRNATSGRVPAGASMLQHIFSPTKQYVEVLQYVRFNITFHTHISLFNLRVKSSIIKSVFV